MSAGSAGGATPNRRGVRSREAILDAAERIMAEQGYDAATAAQIVKACGVPASSIYHYYGSKQGVLLAVMERGARRFFDGLPAVREQQGTPAAYLAGVIGAIADALAEHPDFLRLVVVMSTQPASAAETAAAQDVVGRVREEALARLRILLAVAFDLRPSSELADRLARFALAAIDGAFVATAADRTQLRAQLELLPAALIGLYGALGN